MTIAARLVETFPGGPETEIHLEAMAPCALFLLSSPLLSFLVGNLLLSSPSSRDIFAAASSKLGRRY
jgi:hypothetical protein